MMLTPVAAASSASDQSRDSRNARMAAPADSRLTARSGHGPDVTHASPRSRGYTFLSRFSCGLKVYVYTILPTFRPTRVLHEETDMAHPCAANPELWFGYPDDDGGDGA